MPSSLAIVQKFYPEVKKVVNARKNLNIDLRTADVKAARSKKHDRCAMAVACKHQCKADGAIVSTNAAYVVSGDKATKYFVPNTVSREILSFDRGAGFTAGEYTLYKPYKKKPSGKTNPNKSVPGSGGYHPGRRSPGLRAALSSL